MSDHDLLCPHCHQIDPRAVARLLASQQAGSTATPDFALAVPIERAAEMIGVSLATMRSYIRRGIVPTIQMDDGRRSRRLVRVAALEAVLREHEQEGGPCHDDEPTTPPKRTKGRQLRALR